MVKLARLIRHLVTPAWWARRHLSRADLAAIEAAVRASEGKHRGELRVALEGPLPLRMLWRDASPRERAIELFSELRVWDTEENTGILIYVQLVDRAIEIVADRGIARRVGEEEWTALCRRMESSFAGGALRDGLIAGIEGATALLHRHFPAQAENPDELENAPAVL